MRNILILLILVTSLQGCAIHYMNEKGIRADAEEVRTKIGSIQDGNAYFWSKLEIWFPWKFKTKR